MREQDNRIVREKNIRLFMHISIILLAIMAMVVLAMAIASTEAQAADHTVGPTGGAADYNTLYDALNASANGDNIYVWDGEYSHVVNVFVTTQVTIEGNGTANTFLDVSVAGAKLKITANFVNVTEMSINLTTGISLPIQNADDVYFNDTIIRCPGASPQGFKLENCDRLSLENTTVYSTITAHSWQGIFVDDCDDLSIKNVEVYGFYRGIFIDNSLGDTSRMIIEDSIVWDNGFGIECNPGIGPTHHGDNWTLRNNYIHNNSNDGCYLIGVDYAILSDTYFRSNTPVYGTDVYLDTVTYFTVENNTMVNAGSNWFDTAQNCVFQNNTIDSGNHAGNYDFGLRILDTSWTSIYDNSWNDMLHYGLYINSSHNNTIYANTVSNNTIGIGAWYGSANNSIYWNNLVGNGIHAIDNGTNNVWNQTYALGGGNYWDNWTTPDLYSGVNQDVLGSDNIVDNSTSLLGSAGSVDYYPLVTLYPPILPPELTVGPVGSAAGYNSLYDALNATVDGDTVYIWNGTFHQNCTVPIGNRVSIIGNGTTSVMNFTDDGILTLNSGYVNLTNFKIDLDSSDALHIISRKIVNISQMTIEAESPALYGINIQSSNNISIYDSYIYSNADDGIYGIEITSSQDVTILQTELQDWTEAIKIYYGAGGNSRITIEECNIHNGTYGIAPATAPTAQYHGNNITIRNCRIVNNSVDGIYGIGWWDSKIIGCTFSDNTFSTGTDVYIHLGYNVTIENNTMSNAGSNWLQSVEYSTWKNNTADTGNHAGHWDHGLKMWTTNYTTIYGNDFNDFNVAAIWVNDSYNNVFFNNNISNSSIGVDVNGGNNTFYHNNFIGNTIQATDVGLNNVWNRTYPLGGGNYWDNWTTPDIYMGENQDVPNSDYIVDIPTSLLGTAGSKDYYPITQAYHLAQPPLMVTNENLSKGFASIQTAVTAASAGNVLRIFNGTWEYQNATINKSLHFYSFNRNGTIKNSTWNVSGATYLILNSIEFNGTHAIDGFNIDHCIVEMNDLYTWRFSEIFDIDSCTVTVTDSVFHGFVEGFDSTYSNYTVSDTSFIDGVAGAGNVSIRLVNGNLTMSDCYGNDTYPYLTSTQVLIDGYTGEHDISNSLMGQFTSTTGYINNTLAIDGQGWTVGSTCNISFYNATTNTVKGFSVGTNALCYIYDSDLSGASSLAISTFGSATYLKNTAIDTSKISFAGPPIFNNWVVYLDDTEITVPLNTNNMTFSEVDHTTTLPGNGTVELRVWNKTSTLMYYYSYNVSMNIAGTGWVQGEIQNLNVSNSTLVTPSAAGNYAWTEMMAGREYEIYFREIIITPDITLLWPEFSNMIILIESEGELNGTVNIIGEFLIRDSTIISSNATTINATGGNGTIDGTTMNNTGFEAHDITITITDFEAYNFWARSAYPYVITLYDCTLYGDNVTMRGIANGFYLENTGGTLLSADLDSALHGVWTENSNIELRYAVMTKASQAVTFRNSTVTSRSGDYGGFMPFVSRGTTFYSYGDLFHPEEGHPYTHSMKIDGTAQFTQSSLVTDRDGFMAVNANILMMGFNFSIPNNMVSWDLTDSQVFMVDNHHIAGYEMDSTSILGVGYTTTIEASFEPVLSQFKRNPTVDIGPLNNIQVDIEGESTDYGEFRTSSRGFIENQDILGWSFADSYNLSGGNRASYQDYPIITAYTIEDNGEYDRLEYNVTATYQGETLSRIGYSSTKADGIEFAFGSYNMELNKGSNLLTIPLNVEFTTLEFVQALHASGYNIITITSRVSGVYRTLYAGTPSSARGNITGGVPYFMFFNQSYVLPIAGDPLNSAPIIVGFNDFGFIPVLKTVQSDELFLYYELNTLTYKSADGVYRTILPGYESVTIPRGSAILVHSKIEQTLDL